MTKGVGIRLKGKAGGREGLLPASFPQLPNILKIQHGGYDLPRFRFSHAARKCLHCRLNVVLHFWECVCALWQSLGKIDLIGFLVLALHIRHVNKHEMATIGYDTTVNFLLQTSFTVKFFETSCSKYCLE